MQTNILSRTLRFDLRSSNVCARPAMLEHHAKIVPQAIPGLEVVYIWDYVSVVNVMDMLRIVTGWHLFWPQIDRFIKLNFIMRILVIFIFLIVFFSLNSLSFQEHGYCVNCQHNTEGDQCERCKPGFIGNARQGTPHDCQPAATRPPCNCNNHSPRGCDSFGRCLVLPFFKFSFMVSWSSRYYYYCADFIQQYITIYIYI